MTYTYKLAPGEAGKKMKSMGGHLLVAGIAVCFTYFKEKEF